jgi:hypothetical protein
MVIYSRFYGNTVWKEKALPLGKTKEVFDAELYGIQEALKLAYREHSIRILSKVTIFSDSQAALKRAQLCRSATVDSYSLDPSAVLSRRPLTVTPMKCLAFQQVAGD